MRLKNLFAAAIPLLLAAQAGQAYVYRFTSEGTRQHWTAMPVSFAVNQRGSEDISSFTEVENAFKACFQAWDQVTLAEISFSYAGPTASGQVMNDATNLMIFDTYTDGFILSDEVGPTVVGLAHSTFYPSTGEIVDADIIFNDHEYKFTTTSETDLPNKTVNLLDVASHEIGHLLGLDHTFIETGTMWPYAKQGQRVLSEDDKVGARSLYPSPDFAQRTNSFSGTVTDENGDPLWGIFVSAILQSSGEEQVSAITGQDGTYLIEGLAQATGFYLKARSVDLDHLGPYIQQGGSYETFIPQYYSNTSRLENAQAVVSGTVSQGLDFQLSLATILARYDRDIQNPSYVVLYTQNTSTSQYLAVNFPASSLPESFQVFGMTFYNNDENMAWPRIMLTSGTASKPDMDNILRVQENYFGKELDMSTVEWEMYQATNARDLWVVFQMPNKAFVNVGDGPGIISESSGSQYKALYWSVDGGKTFTAYPNAAYDLVLYLTVGLLDDAPVLEPQLQLAVQSLAFGVAKVGAASLLPVPLTNLGGAVLELSGIYSSKPTFFGVSATSITVPAGGADTLKVNFTPKGAVQYTGIVSMATNDPAMGTVNISVAGTGAYPAASVAVQSLDFGELEAQQTATNGLVVRNTGQVSLVLSQVTAGPAPFSAAVSGLEIAAGDSAALQVTFAPTGEGPFSGSLTFTTDDPNHAQFEVALSGTGLPGETAVGCDFNGDGRITISDVIALLIFQKDHPGDLGSDFNGDGKVTISDAISMLLAIRDGTCPDAAQALLSGDSPEDEAPLFTRLSAGQVAYLEQAARLLDLTEQEQAAWQAALYGAVAGSSLPEAYSLAQNYPNPFNPATVIAYAVPGSAAAARVALRVYDIRGALVRVLADRVREPGSYTVFWDGTDESGRRVPSGVYLYRLQAGETILTRKMVVLN
ncbi:MAG: choice-of-anchor D domain-containing protein [Candidatus Glassbacteria bacterium]|nr:choice-of-anchor D domain-containing protein [Candidatus Glassbacteria bacterium]